MNKKEIQELIKKAQSGDEEAKLTLVKNHMDLVWSVVHKFAHLDVEKDDLFQIGCMGLLKSINQFDASYDTTYLLMQFHSLLERLKHLFENKVRLKLVVVLKVICIRFKKLKTNSLKV